jgi:hypothetical protein
MIHALCEQKHLATLRWHIEKMTHRGLEIEARAREVIKGRRGKIFRKELEFLEKTLEFSGKNWKFLKKL